MRAQALNDGVGAFVKKRGVVRPDIRLRVFISLGGLALLTFAGGCASVLPETVPFGAVVGTDAVRSLNGLGVHKKMWESAGAKCLAPQKLSPRLETFDVLVLVGQSYGPPGQVARRWIENWLGRKQGRTVIYFGRDFNANVYYRERTLSELDRKDVPAGELALAKVQVAELNTRIRQIPEGPFCRWFYMDVSLPRRTFESFTGDWAGDAAGREGIWPVGVTLQPPSDDFRTRLPSWLAGPGGGGTLVPASAFNGTKDDAGLVQRSTWRYNELDSTDAWDREFRDLPTSSTLLAGSDGTPLVVRLRSDKFQGSQIITVVNGAPILNGSLVEPLHRWVGEKLIEECLPARRVALLAYDEAGLLITQAPESDARGVGLEMLTVWPLSAITMPAALLGIIVCAVLFPILGRPQKRPQRSVSDFGLHIEALGQMLLEARDESYARSVISDYFKKIRGEAAPPWLDSVGRQTQQLVASQTEESSHDPTSATTPEMPSQIQSVGEKSSQNPMPQ